MNEMYEMNDRAIDIAFSLGKNGVKPFKDMVPAELWESIKAERQNAAMWKTECEHLSWLISDRVKDMERLLTDKLAPDGREGTS